jgi:hypothetical protein
MLCLAGVVLSLPVLAVPAVDLDVRVNLELRWIRGTAIVESPPEGDQMAFLLLANLGREPNPHLGPRAMDATYPRGFEPAVTVIEAVYAGSGSEAPELPFALQPLPAAWQTYSLDDGLLIVDLPAEDRPSEVCIAFRTEIPRRLGDEGIHDGVLTWRFGWYPIPITEQHRAALAEPAAADLPLDIPLFLPAQQLSATIAAAPEILLAVGGDEVVELAASQTASGSRTQPQVRVTNEGPMRTIPLVAGPDYERFVLQGPRIPVHVIYRPGYEAEARLYATYAVDILEDYERRFGPYPHARLVLVQHPGDSGLSLAADGMVWLSGLFFTHRDVTLPGLLDRVTEYVLAHEIAHQWFGLSASPDLAAENWLSEGLAQYCAVSYFEERYEPSGGNLLPIHGAGLIEQFVTSQFGFLNLREHQIELPYLVALRQGFDEPLVLPPAEVRYDNATVVRLYDKGYLVARAIASAIGDDTFDHGLRVAAEQHRGERLTTDALREALEAAAERPLDTLFDTWVRSAEQVDYSISLIDRDAEDGVYSTEVRVERNGGAPQPVTVRATLRSGETVDREWSGADTSEVLVFQTEEPVRRVSIDPDHRLPDAGRLNNHDPVKLVVAASTNAFPLDAYLIQSDPASGGVTISYLQRTRLTVSDSWARAEVLRGRNHRITVEAALLDSDLAAGLAYTYLRYAPVDTGSPSRYLEPDLAWTVGVRREVFRDGSSLIFGVGAQRLPSLVGGGQLAVGLEVTPLAAGRLIVQAFDELRLLPRIYLQGTLTAGFGFGPVPPPLTFDLEEIHSLGRLEGWTWIPQRIGARHKLYAKLALEFPTGGVLPFNLANVAMVDRAVARPFAAAGATWTSLGTFGDTTPHVEAGVEAVFDVSAIGGLLPFRASIGYAVPLVGGGSPVMFIGVSVR